MMGFPRRRARKLREPHRRRVRFAPLVLVQEVPSSGNHIHLHGLQDWDFEHTGGDER